MLKTTNRKPAFADFYNAHYKKVVYYINMKIGNPHDAEDLASEIFMYCFSHYDDYNPEKSSLSTWLYMIVNCRIKNHYRDARTYVDLETLVGVLPDETIDMDACIYLQQLKQQLEKAMERLPERQRKIVSMRYFEEKTNGEIAAELGMSQVNVRVQLSRALDVLEKMCGNMLEGVR